MIVHMCQIVTGDGEHVMLLRASQKINVLSHSFALLACSLLASAVAGHLRCVNFSAISCNLAVTYLVVTAGVYGS